MNYQMEPKPQVGFVEAGKLYFQNATNFKGRARRSEYWMACLFLFVINLAGSFAVGLIGGLLGEAGAMIAGLVYLVWGIYCVVASLSLCVRRLHDTGRSGWWYLLNMVPIGNIFLIVWFCSDSTEDNQWGPNPKYGAAVENAVVSAPVVEPAARPASVPVQREVERIPAIVPPVQQPVSQHQSTYTPTVSTRRTDFIPDTVSTVDSAPAVYGSLYLYSGPMAGQNFRFPEGRTVTIGRSSSRCDVALPTYNVVSGVHCQVTICKNYINITDLGSTNGTFVNGVRLTPNMTVSARNGSTIYLANASCAFQVRFE